MIKKYIKFDNKQFIASIKKKDTLLIDFLNTLTDENDILNYFSYFINYIQESNPFPKQKFLSFFDIDVFNSFKNILKKDLIHIKIYDNLIESNKKEALNLIDAVLSKSNYEKYLYFKNMISFKSDYLFTFLEKNDEQSNFELFKYYIDILYEDKKSPSIFNKFLLLEFEKYIPKETIIKYIESKFSDTYKTSKTYYKDILSVFPDYKKYSHNFLDLITNKNLNIFMFNILLSNLPKKEKDEDVLAFLNYISNLKNDSFGVFLKHAYDKSSPYLEIIFDEYLKEHQFPKILIPLEIQKTLINPKNLKTFDLLRKKSGDDLLFISYLLNLNNTSFTKQSQSDLIDYILNSNPSILNNSLKSKELIQNFLNFEFSRITTQKEDITDDKLNLLKHLTLKIDISQYSAEFDLAFDLAVKNKINDKNLSLLFGFILNLKSSSSSNLKKQTLKI